MSNEIKRSDALGILTGEEYAEEFFRLAGRYPKYVPVSGDWSYRNNRTWARYSCDK